MRRAACPGEISNIHDTPDNGTIVSMWRFWSVFWNEREMAQETDAALKAEEEADEVKG
jgi:hypothetical protein